MATKSPILTSLTVTLSNGTDITIWGQQFNRDKICGFLERDPMVGPQLCCIPTRATSAKAICEFTWGQRIGQFTHVFTASLSGLAVLSLLLYAVYRQHKKRRNRRGQAKTDTDIIDSSLFLNLMVADLIQAIGSLPTSRWMIKGSINQNDPVCSVQAALKQIGIVVVASTSLAIAIQTFIVLVLRLPIRRTHSRWAVAGLWAIVALDVGIPNALYKNGPAPYYGPTGFWCWVNPFYKTEQIVTEYLWMWIAGFSMIILYGIMSAVMLGLVAVDGRRLRLQDKSKWAFGCEPPEELEDQREDRAIARMMLYYPCLYLLCILPTSVTRWMQFSGSKIPYQSTLFAAAIFDLSGLFNVILFWSTRPELVKGGPSNQRQEALPIRPAQALQVHGLTQEERQRTRVESSDADSDDYGRLPDIGPLRIN